MEKEKHSRHSNIDRPPELTNHSEEVSQLKEDSDIRDPSDIPAKSVKKYTKDTDDPELWLESEVERGIEKADTEQRDQQKT